MDECTNGQCSILFSRETFTEYCDPKVRVAFNFADCCIAYCGKFLLCPEKQRNPFKCDHSNRSKTKVKTTVTNHSARVFLVFGEFQSNSYGNYRYLNYKCYKIIYILLCSPCNNCLHCNWVLKRRHKKKSGQRELGSKNILNSTGART